jgi:hypothetical protein
VNVIRGEALTLHRIKFTWTVGAKRHVAAPRPQLEHHVESVDTTTVCRERLVAVFPAIAERTVIHSAPIKRRKPGTVRQDVETSGRE